jgi:hypothetical protein
MKTAIEILTELLHARPIPSVKVSLSRYRGYWGAVRYEIRLGRDGRPTNHPLGAAGKDRRRGHLAHKDADALAEREGRVVCHTRGPLGERDAVGVLRQWFSRYPTVDTHAAAEQLRAIPRWTERCLVRSGLSGLFARAYGALTEEEIALAKATERRVSALQAERKRRGAKETPRCSVRLWRHGIELEATITRAHSIREPGQREIRYGVVGCYISHRTWQAAIREWLHRQPKRIGHYQLYRRTDPHVDKTWLLCRICAVVADRLGQRPPVALAGVRRRRKING